MNRRANIESLQQQVFDLLIIGGGITGAGILMEAAKKGYSCLLLEKGDFASGTSSRSAKLIHGGFRYLRYGQIGMVKESIEERNHLIKTYPHLVKPLPFLFPLYELTIKYRVGMAVYQYLNDEKTLPDYRYIETDEVIRLFPAINTEGLRGGLVYYDAVTNDARLCNEVIADAQRIAGNYALNYCEMRSMQKQGETVSVTALDHLESRPAIFQARCVVNASGVWTDEVIKRATQKDTIFSAPSKGVHLVFPKHRFPCEDAVIIPSYANDGRLNYSVPWENNSVIIGTTDTDYRGDLNNPTSDEEDIDYVIQSLQNFAPSLNITRKDILHVYSGLRPMYNDAAPSYERSRDYHIWWEEDVILNILGGKLTSYHSMAMSLVEELERKFSGSQSSAIADDRNSDTGGDLLHWFVESINERFMERSPEIFSIAREARENIELFHPDFNATIAEAIFYIRKMQCYHLNDLLGRRLSLTYVLNGCPGRDAVIKRAAELMRKECGWTQSEFDQEVEDYYHLLNAKPQATEKRSGDPDLGLNRISKC